MKISTLLIALFCSSFLPAQESSKLELFDLVVQVLQNSYSNFGKESPFIIQKSDSKIFILDLSSISKSTHSQVEEFFVLDLKQVSDVFAVPPMGEEYKVIVRLKKKILITKKNTDYKNLFHEEVITEDIREVEDVWILFSKEEDANNFEKKLMALKKLLHSN